MKRLLVVALMLLVDVVALPTSASAQFDLSKIGGMLPAAPLGISYEALIAFAIAV